MAGPIIGLDPSVGPTFAAAGCAIRVVDAPAGLPEGWPRILDEAMAWTGNQFANESDYIHTLSELDLQETENALQVFKGVFLWCLVASQRRHGPRLVAPLVVGLAC